MLSIEDIQNEFESISAMALDLLLKSKQLNKMNISFYFFKSEILFNILIDIFLDN